MHQTQSAIRNPQSAMNRPRRGFTFVEILFAVMILGIGFIMIAGIFPVALNQTQLNSDETVGSALARNGVHYLEQVPYSQINPPTGPLAIDGRLHPYDGTLFGYVAGNLIPPEDPRYAWVPFYRRGVDRFGQPSTSAQVVVVACRIRTKPNYEPVDFTNGTLVPKLLDRVSFFKNSNLDQADTMTVTGGGDDVLAPGTFVVIANDTSPADSNFPGVNATGWVYRVAGRSTDPTAGPNTWELAPGMDLKASGYNLKQADCYVVGQAKDAVGNYAGGAQDVAVYSSFIQLH